MQRNLDELYVDPSLMQMFQTQQFITILLKLKLFYIDLTLACDERSSNTNEIMMHTLQIFWKNEDIIGAPLAWRDTGLKSSQGGRDSLQALSK